MNAGPKSSASNTWRISISASAPSRIGAALDPFDRLFLRLHLPQPEAGDQLLGLGEGPVDHGPLVAGELDARALRARMEPLAREQDAGLCQLFVVLPHLGQKLLVRKTLRPRCSCRL